MPGRPCLLQTALITRNGEAGGHKIRSGEPFFEHGLGQSIPFGRGIANSKLGTRTALNATTFEISARLSSRLALGQHTLIPGSRCGV